MAVDSCRFMLIYVSIETNNILKQFISAWLKQIILYICHKCILNK